MNQIVAKKKMTLVELLKKMDACDEASDWVKGKGFRTAKQAWDACPEVSWMTYIIDGIGGMYDEGYNEDYNDSNTDEHRKKCMSCRVEHLCMTPGEVRKMVSWRTIRRMAKKKGYDVI